MRFFETIQPVVLDFPTTFGLLANWFYVQLSSRGNSAVVIGINGILEEVRGTSADIQEFLSWMQANRTEIQEVLKRPLEVCLQGFKEDGWMHK